MEPNIIAISTVIAGVIGMAIGHTSAARSADFHGNFGGIGRRIAGSSSGLILGAMFGVLIGIFMVKAPFVLVGIVIAVGVFLILEVVNRQSSERNYRIRHNMTRK